MTNQLGYYNECYDVSQYHSLSVDTEYYYSDPTVILDGEIPITPYFRNAVPLSCQIVFWGGGEKRLFYFLNSELPVPDITSLGDYDVTIVRTDFRRPPIDHFVLNDSVTTYHFYAPLDVVILIGKDRWFSKFFDVKKQRRLIIPPMTMKLSHCETTMNFEDLCALNPGGASDLSVATGVINPHKNLVEEMGYQKNDMKSFAQDHPNEFFLYGMSDPLELDTSLIRKKDSMNQVCKDVFGFDPGYTLANYPRTMGALVSDLIEKWIVHTYPNVFIAAVSLSTHVNKKRYAEFKEQFQTILTHSSNKNEILTQVKKLHNKWSRDNGFTSGLGSNSIPAYHPSNYGSSTVGLGAMVQGGRCVNEDPDESVVNGVLDVDLASCYGSSLSDLTLPVGLPTHYGKERDDPNRSLQDFLKKEGSQFVDNLWMCVVDGALGFEQDLLPSKYNLTADKIQKQISKGSYEGDHTDKSHQRGSTEVAHLGGDFAYTTQQLENAIITSDVWTLIEGVSSNKEIGQWNRLNVEAATYYPRDKEIKDPEQFCQDVLFNPGGIRTIKGSRVDDRNRSWFGIPMKEFVGPLVRHRKALKSMKQTMGDKYDVQQQAIKLIVNSTYGVLASPYFPVGNVLVADVTTARGRCGAWQMSKALNTKQTVTDGGIYQPQTVPHLNSEMSSYRNPSFAALYRKKKHSSYNRCVKLSPLFPETIFTQIQQALESGDTQQLQKHLDVNVQEHVNKFWSFYDVPFKFALEHKIAHTGWRASYTNNADYMIELVYPNAVDDAFKFQKCLTAVRGVNRKDISPKVAHLYQMLYPDAPEPDVYYFTESMAGISELQENALWSQFITAGDTIIRPGTFVPRTRDELSLPSNKKEMESRKKNRFRRQKRLEKSRPVIIIEEGSIKYLPPS